MDEPAHSPERTQPDPELHPAAMDARHGAAVDSEPELDADLDPGPDPELDRHVRALLADVPDPGPMPAAVSRRISAALLDEARLRVDPGPLAVAPGEQGRLGADGRRPDTGGGDLLEMPKA
ncbi:hypothetical protein, partial [Terrabacter terrae]|uniref:hypothetical protein n=1 Tax=Terrabacter terrae TaxID=318434 RepID=UPI0031D2990A